MDENLDTVKGHGHYISNSPELQLCLEKWDVRPQKAEWQNYMYWTTPTAPFTARPLPGKKPHPIWLMLLLFFSWRSTSPLCWKSKALAEQFNQWSLIWEFNRLWNHRFCSLKKQNKTKNPHICFHIKTNGGFLVMTQSAHVTPHSQSHLGWELQLGPCQGSSPETRDPERLQPGALGNALPGHLPSAQTQTKHWMLGPVPQPSVGKGTAAGLSVSQCFNPALLVQISAWSRERNISTSPLLSFPHTQDTGYPNKSITLGPNFILAAGETWGISSTQDPSVFLARDSHQNQLLSGFSLPRNAGRNLSVKFIDLTNTFRLC